MNQESSSCVDLNKVCTVLAKISSVQVLVEKEVGAKDFPTALHLMKLGDLQGELGATIYNFLDDEIENESTQVWSGLIDGEYPVHVNEYHGVYWVWAMEYDSVGYFLDEATAVSYVELNWDNVCEDGTERDDEDEGDSQDNVDTRDKTGQMGKNSFINSEQESMQPHDFLFKTYSIIINHPFEEERLGGRYSADILKLSVNDASSLGKARVSAICMILSLCYRAATEAFFEIYGKGDGSPGQEDAMAKLFESIVEARRGRSDLPAYVDATYFPRWHKRYQGSVKDKGSQSLKYAALTTFSQQATFQYEDEPRIDASEDLILFLGDEIYNNYASGLRDLLGPSVL